MRIKAAIAMLTAGTAAAGSLTGCLPFGGCGGVDPTDVAAFTLAVGGRAQTPARIDGLAAAPGGVWILTDDLGAYDLALYDRVGGAIVRHTSVAFGAGAAASGLAYDGASLWIGVDGPSGASGWKIDPATGGRLATIPLPAGTVDLGWDGTDLIAVQGVGAIESIDVATGALVASVPVRRLAEVSAVAHHDGETWVAQPGQPALVYDTTGTLLASASADLIAGAAAPSRVHMTFVGEELVVADGTALVRYAIDRTAPTAP